jgi:hypothetical protein
VPLGYLNPHGYAERFPNVSARSASSRDTGVTRSAAGRGVRHRLRDVAEVHICPGCGAQVADEAPFVRAQEYENAPGFGQRDFDPGALAKGAVRRFHVGHFVDRIGNRVYALLDDA